jgi:hypothetical protein
MFYVTVRNLLGRTLFHLSFLYFCNEFLYLILIRIVSWFVSILIFHVIARCCLGFCKISENLLKAHGTGNIFNHFYKWNSFTLLDNSFDFLHAQPIFTIGDAGRRGWAFGPNFIHAAVAPYDVANRTMQTHVEFVEPALPAPPPPKKKKHVSTANHIHIGPNYSVLCFHGSTGDNELEIQKYYPSWILFKL